MFAYCLRRILILIPTLFIIIALSFLLIYSAPGGPFDAEAALDPQIIENLRQTYNLDKPLHQQFGLYLGRLMQGDLGPSMIYRDFTVNELLGASLPISINLGLKSLLLAILLGCSIGIAAALKRNSKLDYGLMFVSMSGIAVPSFVVAPLLTLFFGIYLKEIPGVGSYLGLPVAGWGGLRNQILPIIALALPQIAIIARLTRASMIEVLSSNYVRAARMRGLPERNVILNHALPAALLPIISYLGPALAGVITGSVIIEQIFDLPGVGRYFVQGAMNRDYTLVLGIILVFSTTVLLLNLIVDILYGYLDPRVRVDE